MVQVLQGLRSFIGEVRDVRVGLLLFGFRKPEKGLGCKGILGLRV